VAVGALLGTAISVGNREGYPDGAGEKIWASLVIGTAIGIPLGIIGGLIGDAFKKPVSAGPLSP
jgi:cation transporter-like permease